MPVSEGASRPLDAAKLHPQRREDLADVIVQLPRQVLPLFLLRRDQPLRELAHLAFRVFGERPLFFGSPLEHAQPEHDHQRDGEAEQQTAPQQPARSSRNAACRLGDLGALRGQIRVVQLLDFLRDRQNRLAPRHDLAPQKAGAAKDLFGRRPVEERIERLPVVVELRLQAEDLLRRVRRAARAAP